MALDVPQRDGYVDVASVQPKPAIASAVDHHPLHLRLFRNDLFSDRINHSRSASISETRKPGNIHPA